jgi:anti-anti-sigma regulatory factor
MLRITIHNDPQSLTIQLEGKLAGPWVRALEDCWHSLPPRSDTTAPTIDLTGVTYIDAAGKTCLTTLHREGAEFLAADCLTKAIVAEITHAPLSA